MDQLSRSDALGIIRDARERFGSLIEGMTDEQIEARAVLGGGDWSVKDLIGHLSAWENRALAMVGAGDPEMSSAALETDEFNAAEVERKTGWPISRVREEANKSYSSLLETIENMSDEDWNVTRDVPGRGEATFGQIMGFILAGDAHGPFAHDLAHLDDVKAYVGSL